MSELKAFNCVDSDVQEFCEPRLAYLKSEADKVIAEKDAEIAELKAKNKRLEELQDKCGRWAEEAVDSIAKCKLKIRRLSRALSKVHAESRKVPARHGNQGSSRGGN